MTSGNPASSELVAPCAARSMRCAEVLVDVENLQRKFPRVLYRPTLLTNGPDSTPSQRKNVEKWRVSYNCLR